jgi:adenylylsulfate kinase
MKTNLTKKPIKSGNLTWQPVTVTREHHEAQNGHRGAIIWFTGLSGSGKSTLANAVQHYLHKQGCQTFRLDGDNVRHGLCGDLGFSTNDRQENIRRIGEVAKLFIEAGGLVLASFISPYRVDRERVRNMIQPTDFIEIYCDTPIDICETRDVKGLYKKARNGELANFTGISSPYEAPTHPELVLNTGKVSLDGCVQQVILQIISRGIFTLQGNGI